MMAVSQSCMISNFALPHDFVEKVSIFKKIIF